MNTYGTNLKRSIRYIEEGNSIRIELEEGGIISGVKTATVRYRLDPSYEDRNEYERIWFEFRERAVKTDI